MAARRGLAEFSIRSFDTTDCRMATKQIPLVIRDQRQLTLDVWFHPDPTVLIDWEPGLITIRRR